MVEICIILKLMDQIKIKNSKFIDKTINQKSIFSKIKLSFFFLIQLGIEEI